MLDSVPLGRFCQRAWAPDFKDTWSAGDVARYLTYTLPAPWFENGLNLIGIYPGIYLIACVLCLYFSLRLGQDVVGCARQDVVGMKSLSVTQIGARIRWIRPNFQLILAVDKACSTHHNQQQFAEWI